MAKRFLRRIAKSLMVTLNLIVTVFFLISCLSPYVNPTTWSITGLAALAVPYLIFKLIFFIILSLTVKPVFVLIPLPSPAFGRAPLPGLASSGSGLGRGPPAVTAGTGPVRARQGVRVEMDEQGGLRGHAMFSGDADYAASWYAPGNGSQTSDQQPDWPTTISLSTEAFTRRAAGRRSVSDTAYGVVGDEAMARRVLEALVVTH